MNKEELHYFEIRGYTTAYTINGSLDKLIEICSKKDLIRFNIQVMDPLTGHMVQTTIENGCEQK